MTVVLERVAKVLPRLFPHPVLEVRACVGENLIVHVPGEDVQFTPPELGVIEIVVESIQTISEKLHEPRGHGF